MSISPFRLCVLFLLLIGFVLPVSNSFAQTDVTDEMQKEELVTRAPRETDGTLAWKLKEGLSLKIYERPDDFYRDGSGRAAHEYNDKGVE